MSKFETVRLKELVPYKSALSDAWLNKDQALKLDWNESTIGPSKLVIDKLLNEVLTGALNWYPPVKNAELISSLATYSNVDASEIEYFAGSDALHEYVVGAFVDIKDTILIFQPSYDNFRAVVESAGAKTVNVSIDPKDKEQVVFLLNIIKPKVVYIVRPNNPTGECIDIQTVEYYLSNFENILFLVDEAYIEFSKSTSANALVKKGFTNLIVSRTFSKALGLASFRFGYCVANSELINSLRKVRNPKSVSTLSQVAAMAVLDDIEYISTYINLVDESRTELINLLKNKDYLSQVWDKSEANFVFVKFKSQEIKQNFLIHIRNEMIFVRDYGHISGYELNIRITVPVEEDFKRLIQSINSF